MSCKCRYILLEITSSNNTCEVYLYGLRVAQQGSTVIIVKLNFSLWVMFAAEKAVTTNLM